MNSVVNVVISQIEDVGDHIVIPIWMHTSTDDSPDAEMPELAGVNLRMHVSYEKLRGSREEVEGRLRTYFHENYRTNLAGSGYYRLMEELDKFFAKYDISVYGKRYIPEPASSTRH